MPGVDCCLGNLNLSLTMRLNWGMDKLMRKSDGMISLNVDDRRWCGLRLLTLNRKSLSGKKPGRSFKSSVTVALWCETLDGIFLRNIFECACVHVCEASWFTGRVEELSDFPDFFVVLDFFVRVDVVVSNNGEHVFKCLPHWYYIKSKW